MASRAFGKCAGLCLGSPRRVPRVSNLSFGDRQTTFRLAVLPLSHVANDSVSSRWRILRAARQRHAFRPEAITTFCFVPDVTTFVDDRGFRGPSFSAGGRRTRCPSNGVSTLLDSSRRRSPTIAQQPWGADDLGKLLLFDGLTDEQLCRCAATPASRFTGVRWWRRADARLFLVLRTVKSWSETVRGP